MLNKFDIFLDNILNILYEMLDIFLMDLGFLIWKTHTH